MSAPLSTTPQAAQASDKLGSAREAITYFRPMEDREADHAPLSARLIRRMFTYTRPYAARRNWLFVADLRARPAVARAGVDDRPDHQRPDCRTGTCHGIYLHAGIYLVLVLLMVVTLHFRQRFALELGEAVAHDMRLELFRKLTTLPMSFFNKTKFGRIISRMTSDIDSVRVAVQDVAFVVTIQAVQMTVAAAADGVVQLEAVLADAAAGAGDMAGQPELPARGEPPAAQAARDLEPADLHPGRIGGRHPGHAGVCAAGDQRRLLPQAGEPARRKQRGRGAGLGGVHSPAPDEEPVFLGAVALLSGYGALRWHGWLHMEVGDLVMFFFLANFFFDPVQVIGNQYNQALSAMAGAERYFRLHRPRARVAGRACRQSPAADSADGSSSRTCISNTSAGGQC